MTLMDERPVITGPDRVFPMEALSGDVIPVHCPPFCTFPHCPPPPPEVEELRCAADDTWHVGPHISFDGPGDWYEQDGPYRVMTARLSAEPYDDGSHSKPYLYFDTANVGQGDRLDVAGADRVIAELKTYVDQLTQLRNQLAQITEEER